MPPASALPIPAHLSERARSVLAFPRPEFTFPPRDDITGWTELIGGVDAWLEDLAGPVDPRLQVDDVERGGVHTYVISGPEVDDIETAPVCLDLHGGGLIFGGGRLSVVQASADAVSSGMVFWTADYRMPPLHPYPAALDDVVAVYRALLESRRPEDIVVRGSSAGGNLAAALMLRARAEGLPMPAALILHTPEVDLTESGDSFHTLADACNNLASLAEVNLLYANGADLADPYLSPLFGDVSAFPPTFLTSGTRDLYLSNTVRMHRKLRAAGVDAELHVFEAMPHGGFGGAPEDDELADEVDRFLARHVSVRPRRPRAGQPG